MKSFAALLFGVTLAGAQLLPPAPPMPPTSVQPQSIVMIGSTTNEAPVTPTGFMVIDQRITNWIRSLGFAWGTNNWSEPNFVGYKIYHGPASRFYTNFVRVIGRTNLYLGYFVSRTNAHYFAMTAYNDAGIESALSAELRWPVEIPYYSHWRALLQWQSTTNLAGPFQTQLTVTNYFTRTNSGQMFYRALITLEGVE